MIITKTKWLTLVIAIFFAILQALQPFIHAHLDAEHPIQEAGFHVGDEHEAFADLFGHMANHAIANIDHVSHTISVASGIKQDLNLALLADALCVILLFFCFVVVLISRLKLYPPISLISCNTLKLRLPASRAPPQS